MLYFTGICFHRMFYLSAEVLIAVTDGVRKDENVKWLMIIKLQRYVHHVTVSKTTN